MLNWLTQGIVLGLAAAAGLRMIPRARTQTRHGFLWAAYLSLLALPVVAPLLTLTQDAAGMDAAPAVAAPLVTVPTVWWTSTTVMVGVWVAWFAIQALAFARDVVTANRAKRHGQACPADLLAQLSHWSRVSPTGRPTHVVLSKSVHAAGVLGCGAPVIAIAPRVLRRLAAADLDRVLVHEWAHVQRRDDLAHIVQRLVRAVVGWHPTAWWLERQLNFEREVLCDEVAVRVTGSAKRYAECLLTIAALKHRPGRSVPVLAAVSRFRLHHRIERIVAVPGAATVRVWRPLAVVSAVAVVSCALALGTVHVATSAPTSGGTNAAAPPVAAATETTIADTPGPVQPTAAVSSPERAMIRRAPALVRIAPRDGAVPERSVETLSMLPMSSVGAAVGGAPRATLADPVVSTPAESVENEHVPAPPPVAQNAPGDASAGWSRAADVGVTIGHASRTAGVATAGFFRRFGKKIAGSF
jgi:D-alanyl-D-alanine endopeptidase (penicillin-binding protein 7)